VPGSASGPGGLCDVSGRSPYFNDLDIEVVPPPSVGNLSTITTHVRNDGTVSADVIVNFGVYNFSTGQPVFFHIGAQRVTVPGGTTVDVSQPWTPTDPNHQCMQLNIDYASDQNHLDNVTQRNLEVSKSVYNVRVENPWHVRAKFEVQIKSGKDGWMCRMKPQDKSFTLDPTDCPRDVEITFDAPRNARISEAADCDVRVMAVPLVDTRRKPKGKEKKLEPLKMQLIGGVVARTFVPKPCRIVGMVVDEVGKPIPGVKLEWVPVRDKNYGPMKAETDEDGIFDVKGGIPDVMDELTIEKGGVGSGKLRLRPQCGAKTRIVLTKNGARLAGQP
jgi:hypothetical protein